MTAQSRNTPTLPLSSDQAYPHFWTCHLNLPPVDEMMPVKMRAAEESLQGSSSSRLGTINALTGLALSLGARRLRIRSRAESGETRTLLPPGSAKWAAFVITHPAVTTASGFTMTTSTSVACLLNAVTLEFTENQLV
ncbi:hypothetical protein SKAU_G00130680 [Synaphobranchus kaupii]|uniref:Uncharacterized protein n=1 Tax=Synaphobranchus kaupii TaxID=118154 RepID=A0A9Q1FQG2_SYNKA|nr:hypothetical protein SKAU_G00130680 [Synaphobranchus kaupii]